MLSITLTIMILMNHSPSSSLLCLKEYPMSLASMNHKTTLHTRCFTCRAPLGRCTLRSTTRRATSWRWRSCRWVSKHGMSFEDLLTQPIYYLYAQLQPNDHKTLRNVAEELRIFESIRHKHLINHYGVEVGRKKSLVLSTVRLREMPSYLCFNVFPVPAWLQTD